MVQESVELEGDKVIINNSVLSGQDIRCKGPDIQGGKVFRAEQGQVVVLHSQSSGMLSSAS